MHSRLPKRAPRDPPPGGPYYCLTTVRVVTSDVVSSIPTPPIVLSSGRTVVVNEVPWLLVVMSRRCRFCA
eukprot:5697669-Pyramimonas_sp.AAC.1